jgi:hypothetical protein
MKSVHYLKTRSSFFINTRKGNKLFEIRINDRDFKEGDEVYLCEFHPITNVLSGLQIRGEITYVLKEFIGLEKGYVAFGFIITQMIKTTSKTEPGGSR